MSTSFLHIVNVAVTEIRFLPADLRLRQVSGIPVIIAVPLEALHSFGATLEAEETAESLSGSSKLAFNLRSMSTDGLNETVNRIKRGGLAYILTTAGGVTVILGSREEPEMKITVSSKFDAPASQSLVSVRVEWPQPPLFIRSILR